MSGHAAQERLGDLYGEVARLVVQPGGEVEDSMGRAAMARLVRWHGAAQVAWVLGVIKNDVEASGR